MDLGAARSIVQPLSLLDAAERHLTADSLQPTNPCWILSLFLLSAVDCRLSASLEAVGWNPAIG